MRPDRFAFPREFWDNLALPGPCWRVSARGTDRPEWDLFPWLCASLTVMSSRILERFGTNHPHPFRRVSPGWLCLLTIVLGQAPSLPAAESVAILPAGIVLDGPHATQRVVLERLVDGRAVGDLTPLARWQVADPELAVLEEGVLRPRRDGETRLVAEVAGQTVEVPVTIRGSARVEAWSFRHDVQTAGCNMGACHGTPSGKNGFKLSLRGFDPVLDHQQLTRDVLGRRSVSHDPNMSLLLLKGLAKVPHEGGQRFPSNGVTTQGWLRAWSMTAPTCQPCRRSR